SRSQIQRLRDVLERILPNLPVEIVDLLASLDAAPSAIDLSSPASLTPAARSQGAQLDLPEFLMRRRSYKSRRSSNSVE
ncbi:hypothetical protein H6F43_06215, partial [Leptolyngbya sp. FACHB-36]